MHSLCALARSSAFMPAVFLLHLAILLSGFSGLPTKQVFIKDLRSSPFMSLALSLQVFIFSCCGVILVSAAVLVSAVILVSAATAGPQANKAARQRVRVFFMVSLMVSRGGGFLSFVEGWGSGSVYDTPIVRSNDFGHRPGRGCRILLSCTATSAPPVWR